MTLDEQKEIVAQKACYFVAEQLEGKKIKVTDSFRLMGFLSSGIEGADSEADLKKLAEEMKQVYASLSAFDPGI